MDQLTPFTQFDKGRAILIGACGALLALAHPVASASEVLLLNVFTSKGSYSYTVPSEKAIRLPKWRSAQEQPPLDIGRAIKIAVDAHVGPKPSSAKASLQEVKLSRTASSEKALVWFYQVSLQPTNRSLESAYFTTIVLMDGTIVKPIFQQAPAN